jgi:eukaryotic-like serine/threonine-protein kinase
MAFSAGTRFGPYEVFDLLGAGGMGEVYRARDTRLNRDVALKILPDMFSGDSERRARFEREAQVLASMNHSQIAQIYGLEESEGVRAIVMELVPGETLTDRIARGPIPFDEALPIARQIAEALEVAHELGVVHRDLKPANVKVRPDGAVKVLDFGLAKLVQGSGAGSQAGGRAGDLTASPTMASPVLATGVGVLLGTAAYMSPEQARGRDADRRSDLWAFGCVLYEMLTGQRAFDGEEVTDLIVAIVSRDPDWGRLPPDTPQPIQRLLRRCLVKSPKNRLADAAVARIEIDDAMAAPSETGTIAVAPPTKGGGIARSRMVSWAVAAIFAMVAARALLDRSPRPSTVAFSVPLAEGLTFTTTGRLNLAVSRDGSQIAYSVNGRLFRRLEGEFDGRPIPGTVTSLRGVISDFHPVWTPDGESLVYIPSGASGQMAIVRVGKGTGLSFGVPSIIPALVTGSTTSGPPRAWDILADGSFIGPIVPDESSANVMLPQIRVVLNWTEQLTRLSPAKDR